MREENHPDYFAAAAEERLATSDLESLLLRTYSLSWEVEDIIAAVIHQPESGPLAVDPPVMASASQHDAALAQALSALELRTHAPIRSGSRRATTRDPRYRNPTHPPGEHAHGRNSRPSSP
ncbi:hypothetical protein ACFVUW_28800 [Streptomyces xiamenensis]|uniref:hypothetical protein n=1 Tax=Streptomyces xiamenensis TaxID=408015 RepID=UPI0036E1DC75